MTALRALSFLSSLLGGKRRQFQDVTDLLPEISEKISDIFKLRGIDLSQFEANELASQFLKTSGEYIKEFIEQIKQETEKLEPDVQKIILSATGDENSTSETAQWIRQYIWSPYNDPDASLEILQGYARMTDQVIQKLFISKRHQEPLRYSKGNNRNLARLDEAFKALALEVRQNAWDYGPDMIEISLREFLKSFYSKHREDRFSYPRYEKLIFGAKTVPSKQNAGAYHSKAKTPSESKQNKFAEKPVDIAAELARKLEQENAVHQDLVTSIQQYQDALPALMEEMEAQIQQRRIILAIFEENQILAEESLNKKFDMLSLIEARQGNIEGYETPVEWVTLIRSRRADHNVLDRYPLSQAKPLPSMQGVPDRIASNDDLDILLKNDVEEKFAPIADQIKDIRKQNVVLQMQDKHLELQAVQLKKKTESCRLEAEKITSRAITLEEVIVSLKNDIVDLESDIDLNNGHEGTVAMDYPALDQLESWAEQNLKGRVCIHRNAFNEAARLSLTHKHPEWIYQGLELLANEYWDQITSGDYDVDTAKTLRSAFNEKLQNNHMRIGGSVQDIRGERMRQQYSETFNGQRYFLDQHLRRGTSRDQNNILCIYFTWKASSRQILVGHLPSHLELANK